MLADNMQHIIVSDFGRFVLPKEIGEALAKVPTRENGKYDRRFKEGRRAIEWEARQHRRIEYAYKYGRALTFENF